MGISQHTTGTDNARCLIALCAITGNVGRPGTGLHPLRGQNNVQGASDAGLIPMFYPDYQPADDPAVQGQFEQAWGTASSTRSAGLTVTEIIGSALKGGVRGMYMLGENPFLSDPNINKVRKALAALDFLVVQDIFLTETAEFADVILPASSYLEKDGTYTNTDRRVQLGRKVLDPPGQARRRLADRPGHRQPDRARTGLRARRGRSSTRSSSLMPSYTNLSYDNLGPTGKLYPNPDPEHSDGTVVMFDEKFNTDDGLAHLVPAEWLPAKELPDDEYPFVLNTGRLLEHWHTGSMTRRSFALDAIAPQAEVYLHPDDAAELGLADGDAGPGELAARVDRAGGARLAPRDAAATASSRSTSARRRPTCSRSTRSTRSGRSPSSSSAPCGSSRRGRRRAAEALMAGATAACPASRRGPGKFPGPSLIPSLQRDPGAGRLAAPRGAGRAGPRDAPAAVRDRRPDLVLSALPHRAAAGTVEMHVCRDLSCWLHGADEQIAAIRERYGDGRRGRARRGVLHRPLRHRPGRDRQRAARSRLAEADGADRRGRTASAPPRPRPPPPAPRRGRTTRTPPARRSGTPVAARRARRRAGSADQVDRDAQGLRAARHGRRRLPDRREVGARRGAGRHAKYVICNADESEPGTFKDRQILAEQPHLVIEGMLLGMLAVGAEQGWVFIRHEYGPEEAVIRREIEAAARGRAGRSGLPARHRPAAARSRCSPRRAATSSARSRR